MENDTGLVEDDTAIVERQAAEAAAEAAQAAADAAAAEAAEARAEAALAAARAAEDEAAVAAAELALAEAQAKSDDARAAAQIVADAAAAEAAEARAEAALAAARAAEDEAAVAAAEVALAEARALADEAQAAAVAAQAEVKIAQAEVEAAHAAAEAAEAAEAAPGVSLDDLIISTPDLVLQADYARDPYAAPAHAAGLLAFGGYLWRYDAQGNLIADLATDFPEVSEDGLTMTVTLRLDLVYSDGTPVVAQDAVVTLQRAKADGPFPASLGAFDYAEAVDDRTIVYHMIERFDCRATQIVCIEQLPLHPHEQVLADPEAYFAKPASASQYVVADWAPGSPTMVLEANPLYWRGEPAIKRLTLMSATEPLSRLLQVAGGTAAMGIDIPVAGRADLPPEVNQIVHPIGGTFWFVVRSDSPGPLADVRVRKAMCLAMDRSAINEGAFFGTAEPVGAVLSQYRTGWVHENVVPVERDVEGAKALLEEAGFGSGFEVRLQTRPTRSGWTDAARILAKNWADIGIVAEVQLVEDAVAIQNIVARNYDVMWAGSAGDNLSTLRLLFHPESFWSKSVGFSDEAVTAALDELALAGPTGDPEASQRLQTEVQALALDIGANYCPMGERAILVASRLPPEVLTMIPASENFWVAPAPE